MLGCGFKFKLVLLLILMSFFKVSCIALRGDDEGREREFRGSRDEHHRVERLDREGARSTGSQPNLHTEDDKKLVQIRNRILARKQLAEAKGKGSVNLIDVNNCFSRSQESSRVSMSFKDDSFDIEEKSTDFIPKHIFTGPKPEGEKKFYAISTNDKEVGTVYVPSLRGKLAIYAHATLTYCYFSIKETNSLRINLCPETSHITFMYVLDGDKRSFRIFPDTKAETFYKDGRVRVSARFIGEAKKLIQNENYADKIEKALEKSHFEGVSKIPKKFCYKIGFVDSDDKFVRRRGKRRFMQLLHLIIV